MLPAPANYQPIIDPARKLMATPTPRYEKGHKGNCDEAGGQSHTLVWVGPEGEARGYECEQGKKGHSEEAHGHTHNKV